MYARILISVAAWAAGAVVATAGSLLAISVLGQGIVPGSVRTLSADDVARALAAESAGPSSPGTPSPTDSVTAAGSSHAAASASAPPSGSSADAPDPAVASVLTSAGGSVIADCTQAGAYLSSWSPAQGFAVRYVVRGPAYLAKVKFVSGTTAIVLDVVCRSGVPTATSQTGSETGDD